MWPNSPPLRKICLCGFRLCVCVFSRLLSDTLNVYTAGWSPTPQLVSFPSISSPCVTPFPSFFHKYSNVKPAEFSAEFPLFVSWATSFTQPDTSMSSQKVSHAHLDRSTQWFYPSPPGVETTTQTHHSYSQGSGPDIIPQSAQALLIACGLSGVSALLFSLDTIVAKVETVTRRQPNSESASVSQSGTSPFITPLA